MRLSQTEKDRREAEKFERKCDRLRVRLKKLTRGAVVSFDSRGYVCLMFPDGQIFKCRGPIPAAIFGHAPEGIK